MTTIQPIRLSDNIDGVVQLYCQVWREPPWLEEWDPKIVAEKLRCVLKRDDGLAFVAQNEVGVAGFTWGHEVDRGEMQRISEVDFIEIFSGGATGTRRIFYIAELATAATSRVCGVGRSLSLQLIRAAQASGCSAVLLRTDTDAIPAKSLYESLGFVELPVNDGRHCSRTYWLLEL